MSHFRIAFVVLLVSLCPVVAHAADLTLDGQAHLDKLQGLPLSITITGEPGAQTYLFIDVSPGPVLFLGNLVDLGFTPAVLLLPLGPMPPSGEMTLSGSVPMAESAIGLTVYLLAVVASDPSPPLWETDGASLTMLDRNVELAGNPLASFPFVEHVKAFNEGSNLSVAVDVGLYPWAVGAADLYVVEHKSRAQWLADPTLTDVTSSGPETETITNGGVQSNTFVVDFGDTPLPGIDLGVAVGHGYDVVVDLDQDGTFDGEDLIDGFDAEEAGLYVVHDLQLPGPHPVTEIIYSGGTFLDQDLYYPSDIASMGVLPLLIVSHGNGHNYQWYDHIGNQMASYGWVVMSHSNNTGPGIETASTTTLTNTDYLLGNLGTIGGGVLQGHIDGNTIAWIGHSRGGEGVTRAYDRLVEGQFVPANYTAADIKMISSIAPTDFLGPASSTPHDRPYHLWVGGSDADVTGCANNDVAQSFHLLGRAVGPRWSISLHGVGHGDFHASTGSVATGPCLVGKPNTHTIMRAYLLALGEHVIHGNIPAGDFLYRQWESFRPIGAPLNACVVVDLTAEEPSDAVAVIDDFQTNAATGVSSSGGAVTGSATIVAEGVLNDTDIDFTWDGEDMSGFTWGRPNDVERGVVVEFGGQGDRDLSFALVPQLQDASDYRWLSFRACQITRNPLTTGVLADMTFAVTLTDLDAVSSTVNIGAFGGGIEEPYQRTGCGIGAGWGNEFETIRIPLEAYVTDGSGLDLSRLASVTFRFGPSFGSTAGRIGLDALELVED